MKKKILGVLFALLLAVPLLTINAKEKAKVKVYVFEAGGCPYCEAQIDYLKGLDSYNKKFTIEIRELYVDHINWEQGKDYQLGKAVAEKFQKDGFENASYQGTPFVVISDLYAAASYSTDLESYINKAYKNGDKDVVNQIAKKLKVSNKNSRTAETTTTGDNDDEVGVVATTGEEYDNTNKEATSPNIIVVILGVAVVVGAMIFIIKRGSVANDEDEEDDFDDEEEYEDDEYEDEEIEEEKPVKKTTRKTAKKTTKKPVRRTRK